VRTDVVGRLKIAAATLERAAIEADELADCLTAVTA
jgi:hypothetical protein